MRIGLGTHFKQQPFVEFAFEQIEGDLRGYKVFYWRVWTSFNPDTTSGTYLALYEDGTVDQVTIENNTILSITRIATGVVIHD